MFAASAVDETIELFGVVVDAVMSSDDNSTGLDGSESSTCEARIVHAFTEPLVQEPLGE